MRRLSNMRRRRKWDDTVRKSVFVEARYDFEPPSPSVK
jgi:hypothetical protein